MKPLLLKYLIFPLLMLGGTVFAYRLINIPSRVETAIFCIGFFLIPTLKYPKIGIYYLFCLPLFIPLFRRMYYLISERPTVDYLLLISDGVMGGLILALILLWIINKERSKDLMSMFIMAYVALLFLKVFIGSQTSTIEGLYGFKFNGLYVFFFFASSYILTTYKETKAVYLYTSILLLITALYGIKQIVFGFSGFEQKWLDSIRFTTLRIEGVVRPFSTYLSPAAMADGMTILFMLGMYWFKESSRRKMLLGIALITVAIPPLLIATVRTNWMAVVVGIFLYLFYLRLEKTWIKVGIMILLSVGLIGYSLKGGSAPQYSTVAQQRTNTKSLTDIMIKNRTSGLADPLAEYSVQKRISTWTSIYGESFLYPLGKGQGTTGYAHSYYFQVLGEIGYPGIILFLTILVVGFYRGFRILALSRDPEIRELTRLMITLIFMISFLNLTGTHLHTPPGDIFFWFTMGTISRFYRQTLADNASLAAAEKKAAENTEIPEIASNQIAGESLA